MTVSSAPSSSPRTNTAIDQSRRREEARFVPALLVAGSADHGPPRPEERVITFDSVLSIGRRADEMADADSTWVVRDELVSRLHCRIAKAAEGWEITDLGSRNGTAVDGNLLKAAPA